MNSDNPSPEMGMNTVPLPTNWLPVEMEMGMGNVEPRPEGLNILVVEDHVDCAVSMAVLLRIHGHRVEVTLNGRDALATAKTKRPDVVLLDIGLPGMDGYEVARQLRRLDGEKTPFLIAISGYGMDTDRQRSAAAGIDVHLLKPVELGYLIGLLTHFEEVIH